MILLSIYWPAFISMILLPITLFISHDQPSKVYNDLLIGNDASLQPPTGAFTLYLPLISKNEDCFQWHGQIPLQTAVDQNLCVQIQTGVWTTTVQIVLQSGHILLGEDKNASILRAASPWTGNGTSNGAEAVVHDNGSENSTIANFTIDANNLSTFGVGAHGTGTTVDSVKIINAKCDGVAITAAGWKVLNSTIENNGYSCHTGLPGSGVYITKPLNNFTPAFYAPIIIGNIIRNNGGPALDVDRVWGGTFKNNTVSDNQGWAAISLYSASYWIVENNAIQHPFSASPTHPNHPYCMGGPSGNYAAALAICQDTELSDQLATYNSVLNNQISGWYGIRLIGNDETNPNWVPRFNTIQGNDVWGSTIGCIDDFSPNQSGSNIWTTNNCAGTPDTPPIYF